MRKYAAVIMVSVFVALVTSVSYRAFAKSKDTEGSSTTKACETIQGGNVVASTGESLKTGYDDFGYNYQAHMFNGRYCDYDRVLGGDYCDDTLIMKWNDAWLSNKDCSGDTFLDRHYPLTTYKGSSAWLTNHQTGGYTNEQGTACKYDYFVKIVAVPLDAELDTVNKIWHFGDDDLTDGKTNAAEIGPAIWGDFAIIQEVNNDPCAGATGVQYKSPVGPGFGKF